jgi:hypothetical protein
MLTGPEDEEEEVDPIVGTMDSNVDSGADGNADCNADGNADGGSGQVAFTVRSLG